MWTLRRLGSRRGRRPAHLLRPLRPAASRPGIRRHRGQRWHQHPRLQGPRARQPGLQRSHADHAPRRPGDRPHPLFHDRFEHVGQRPAGLQDRRRPFDRVSVTTATWSTRTTSRSSPGDGASATTDTDVVTAMLAEQMATNGLEDAALRTPADPGRRVQLRLHGRAERLRRTGPARDPTAVDRPPPQRVLLRLGDVCARHRGRDPGARGGAGGTGPDRRPRSSLGAVRRDAARRSLHLRVRLPGPAGLPAVGDLRARGAPRDGTTARTGTSDRGGHGHRRAADRPCRRRRGMRSSRASRTATA